ncbi:peroxiredoxin-6-like [Tubulanus polymorphus]|uniref:peroxiredoxin-6-like n=1 Tax=Tubulanus polymorphus TaxID=672921 RepID=UPI003DA6BD87
MAKLGEVFPNIKAETTEGAIELHDWIGPSWAILFSHPADYTPVCTTELARVVQLLPEFQKRNVKVIALSCDSVDSHHGWSKDVIDYAGKSGSTLPYPIIADADRSIVTQLGMLDPDEKDSKGLPLPARCVYVIGPDKRLKLSILYPATTGRNFNEILRVIDSLQLTATKKVATPVDWKQGDKCMVLPTITGEEAKELFPEMKTKALPSGKEYLRMTPCPK